MARSWGVDIYTCHFPKAWGREKVALPRIFADGNRLKGFCSVEEKARKGYFSVREITIKLSSPTPISEFIIPGQIWVWEISKVSASCCHNFYEKCPRAGRNGATEMRNEKNNVCHFLVGYILWPFLITENCRFQHNHRPSGLGLFKAHNIQHHHNGEWIFFQHFLSLWPLITLFFIWINGNYGNNRLASE